jgi:hypothetical protein
MRSSRRTFTSRCSARSAATSGGSATSRQGGWRSSRRTERSSRTQTSNKAIVIALGRAEYSVWDKFRCLARHWDLVEDLLTEDGPAAAVLWLSRNHVEKF